MSSEAQNIIDRYSRRQNSEAVKQHAKHFYFTHYAQAERELRYLEIIRSKFPLIDEVKVLEIGAGAGGNLLFFKKNGFRWENMYANELVPERIQMLKDSYDKVKLYEGDAAEVQIPENYFDIVFQSTVFTSILDDEVKKKVADKMWSVLKPGGLLLWYDFTFDNPRNKDVKGIKKKEILRLFPEAKNVRFSRVTLAPPIGRRVKKWYPVFNIFPFLRTHIVAALQKS